MSNLRVGNFSSGSIVNITVPIIPSGVLLNVSHRLLWGHQSLFSNLQPLLVHHDYLHISLCMPCDL